jgi:hypothetical protein
MIHVILSCWAKHPAPHRHAATSQLRLARLAGRHSLTRLLTDTYNQHTAPPRLLAVTSSVAVEAWC